MTVIAAAFDRVSGQGAMAADSLYSGVGLPRHYGVKVHRIAGHLVGLAGASMIIQRALPEMRRLLVEDCDVAEVLRATWDALAPHVGPFSTERLPSFPFEVLVLSPAGIWGLDGDRSVVEYPAVAAIGTGHAYALGAMWALARPPGVDHVTLVQRGVEAAIEYDVGCGGSVQLERLCTP